MARNYLSNSASALLMIFAMLPGLLFALFERHGQPLEVVIQQMIQCCFIRPKERPYQTNNAYACYVTFPHYYDTTTPPFCPQNAKKIRGRFCILSMTVHDNQTHTGSFSCSWIRKAPSMAPSTMGKYSSGQSCSLWLTR